MSLTNPLRHFCERFEGECSTPQDFKTLLEFAALRLESLRQQSGHDKDCPCAVCLATVAATTASAWIHQVRELDRAEQLQEVGT